MTDENKRIEIDDLPRAERELTDDEEKSVTGGADGSVRSISIGVIGESTKVNSIGGSLATDVTNPTKP